MPTTLAALLDDAPGAGPLRLTGDGSVVVTEVVLDSRRVVRGALFCAFPGTRHDGHDHAAEAVEAGAAALLVQRPLDLDVPQVVAEDARRATAHLAAAFHGHPSRRLDVVGITGTNGKTTTAHIVQAVLGAAGRATGVIGTLSGTHTTPEAPDLQARLAAFVADGHDAVAMEVSSHALALHRVDGTRFRVGVFTNLGVDHLDFHGTPEAYFAAKRRLFEDDLAEVGVVNADDPHGRVLLADARIPMRPYSLEQAEDLLVGPRSSTFTYEGLPVRLPLGGRFNVSNALAAAAVARELGVDRHAVVDGLHDVPAVPGRFEPVVAGQRFTVLVDYAHTPDGLAAVLAAARDAAGEHRLLVVFGCGGDRDHGKRPAMGAVAAGAADVAVVTSDNPRSEDPAAIIEAVIRGIPPSPRARVVVEPDRRAAIATALAEAGPGDVVVIAGKGHEATQTIGAQVLPFDDRVVARELLEAGA